MSDWTFGFFLSYISSFLASLTHFNVLSFQWKCTLYHFIFLWISMNRIIIYLDASVTLRKGPSFLYDLLAGQTSWEPSSRCTTAVWTPWRAPPAWKPATCAKSWQPSATWVGALRRTAMLSLCKVLGDKRWNNDLALACMTVQRLPVNEPSFLSNLPLGDWLRIRGLKE